MPSPFPALRDAMAELRRDLPEVHPAEARREARREAFMRQTIRVALKAGRRRVAVVCGAWHAPALTLPLPPAVADARLLRGLPRRKVRTTWVPWTHSRLAYASGYGAGIASPGWYSHLWSAPDRPITRWLTQGRGRPAHQGSGRLQRPRDRVRPVGRDAGAACAGGRWPD